jgi:2,3-bisphosphoglycerate-dependent phosphoglycerate mutase
VLVRHGESEWNRRNLFTGWCNPDLTEKGLIEALVAARMLRSRGIVFDVAYTSQLKRAQRTLDIILSELGQDKIPIHFDEALNERHYGDLCGLNKDEARERWGEEQVEIWRRSYDIPPPGGESLKDTEERVMPYYNTLAHHEPRGIDRRRDPEPRARDRRADRLPARIGRLADRAQRPLAVAQHRRSAGRHSLR